MADWLNLSKMTVRETVAWIKYCQKSPFSSASSYMQKFMWVIIDFRSFFLSFLISFFLSFLVCYRLPSVCRIRQLLLNLITLNDIYTIGRTPLEEGFARRRDLYLKTHNTHKRETSTISAGFEPTIAASVRQQTHAERFYRVANGQAGAILKWKLVCRICSFSPCDIYVGIYLLTL